MKTDITDLKLEFLANDAGEKEGLGDPGIETFRDDPYASCGRESGQNSRDAQVDRVTPVKMTFDVLEVPQAEFPGFDSLKETVDICLHAASKEKEKDFFSSAMTLLCSPAIKILRIADFNTKGLVGPPGDDTKPFDSLLKGSGDSNKESETSGGSFGIGKNASFAVSDLRTVFYSTVYQDEQGNNAFAAQGKTRLVSHKDTQGRKRRATGYWGHSDDYIGITSPDLVPKWMRRDELGTTIFAAGFRDEKAWAPHLSYGLLSNFFCAVHRGEMVFEVDNGTVKINSNTLASLFEDQRISIAAHEAGQQDTLQFSQRLYNCLVSTMASTTETFIPGLGKMRIRILVEEGMPKRVGFVRNGMLITTSLKAFGDKLERFAGCKEFIALVEPADDPASKLLKTLENPQHDSFAQHRIENPAKRASAESAMKDLARTLRQVINSAAAISEEEEVVVDELSEFFAEPTSGQANPDPKAENDPEKYVYQPPKAKPQPKRQDSPGPGTKGAGGEPNDSDGGTHSGQGTKPGPSTNGTGSSESGKIVELGEFRNRIVDSANTNMRRIWFTPKATGTAVLRLESTGINSSEVLHVVLANVGAAKRGDVALDVVAGTRIELDVTFDAPYSGPIEAVLVVSGKEA